MKSTNVASAKMVNLPRWVWLSRFLLMMVLILISWLSLTPSPPEQTMIAWDKLNHFAAFFVLAALTDAAFPQSSVNTRFRPLTQYVIKGLALTAYGLSIEVCQWLTGYRFFELMDIVADCTGIIAYVLLVLIYQRISKRQSH